MSGELMRAIILPGQHSQLLHEHIQPINGEMGEGGGLGAFSARVPLSDRVQMESEFCCNSGCVRPASTPKQ